MYELLQDTARVNCDGARWYFAIDNERNGYCIIEADGYTSDIADACDYIEVDGRIAYISYQRYTAEDVRVLRALAHAIADRLDSGQYDRAASIVQHFDWHDWTCRLALTGVGIDFY